MKIFPTLKSETSWLFEIYKSRNLMIDDGTEIIFGKEIASEVKVFKNGFWRDFVQDIEIKKKLKYRPSGVIAESVRLNEQIHI